MAKTEILTHKSGIHQESITKLNYYIIGLILAVLALVIKYSSDYELPTWANRFAFWIWVFGSIGFFFGILHLNRMTEFHAADLRTAKAYESFKDILLLQGGSIPTLKSEVDRISQIEPEVGNRFNAFQNERLESERLYPSGFKKATLSTLIFNLYRFPTHVFLLLFLVSGAILIRNNDAVRGKMSIGQSQKAISHHSSLENEKQLECENASDFEF